ncbi:MAG: DUF1906 domain-containing protein [Nocardioidaceae bacterium]
MRLFGIDAVTNPSTPALHAAGVKFVCRYLAHSSWKRLTRAEVRQLRQANIAIVTVFESTADRAKDGYAAGVADARTSRAQLSNLGAPHAAPVFFAVDFDASSHDQIGINHYLDGAASVLGRRWVGIYGGYWPVHRALNSGKVTFAWQTYAWSGGRWDPRAKLRQYSNGHTLGGIGVDYDHATAHAYGQWGDPKPPPAPKDPLEEIMSWYKDKQDFEDAMFRNTWHRDGAVTNYGPLRKKNKSMNAAVGVGQAREWARQARNRPGAVRIAKAVWNHKFKRWTPGVKDTGHPLPMDQMTQQARGYARSVLKQPGRFQSNPEQFAEDVAEALPNDLGGMSTDETIAAVKQAVRELVQ